MQYNAIRRVPILMMIALAVVIAEFASGGSDRAHAVVWVDPATPAGVQPVGASGDNWRIIFSDEFNGGFGSFNADKWTKLFMDRGTNNGIHGWWRTENVVIGDDGKLHLRVKKDTECSNCYSSGAIDTAGKWTRKFGYFEARIDVITPDGVQSAFWLQNPNAYDCDGSANNGAEIDIMEANKQTNHYTATVHWDGYGSCHQQNTSGPMSASGLHNGYQVFGASWRSGSYLNFYYNGVSKRTITNANQIPDIAEFVRLTAGNIQSNFVDGDITTADLSSLTTKVDWIRIYQWVGP